MSAPVFADSNFVFTVYTCTCTCTCNYNPFKYSPINTLYINTCTCTCTLVHVHVHNVFYYTTHRDLPILLGEGEPVLEAGYLVLEGLQLWLLPAHTSHLFQLLQVATTLTLQSIHLLNHTSSTSAMYMHINTHIQT